ncbi:MAG: aminotransferase class I/II-fold pyridoxal phosphate-dependent enzyme [Candidatus Hydrogenedens sp.]|nr:aminotransferase class I/II-fold pyridoxal phosphate-dependent enzyme [Candidatus Hydrogenedens sp.]
MFESLTMAPPDPILGLTDAFKNDPRPEKINLSAGVYKNEANQTPILDSVKRAEQLMLERESSKTYLPIPGPEEYGACVRELLFGADHEVLASGRAVSAQTPGGTGALRVAGDFIHKNLPGASIWVSDPTWANHTAIFAAAGLTVKKYPYYDFANNTLDFDAMTAALRAVPKGDVVLLHGCCHNPSGMDPDAAQWATLAEISRAQGWLPLFDFAYQGFGDGLEEDAVGLRAFSTEGCELMVCSSFSKNFSLYNERVGGLTLVAANRDDAAKALSNLKVSVRCNYSNPPAHGGMIISTILGDAGLRSEWERELAQMRSRINHMRTLFVETLAAQGVTRDYSFITRQRGMFSFAGVTKEQVEELREKHAIYIVASGRVNVAGMTSKNMEHICKAFASVLK